jgi:hypothetical protein
MIDRLMAIGKARRLLERLSTLAISCCRWRSRKFGFKTPPRHTFVPTRICSTIKFGRNEGKLSSELLSICSSLRTYVADGCIGTEPGVIEVEMCKIRRRYPTLSNSFVVDDEDRATTALRVDCECGFGNVQRLRRAFASRQRVEEAVAFPQQPSITSR